MFILKSKQAHMLKVLEIVGQIRKDFPKGIFTKAQFKKLRKGMVYSVGAEMGVGPEEPERMILETVKGDCYILATHSYVLPEYIKHVVSGYKGIFLTLQEAKDYYEKLVIASKTDAGFKALLKKERGKLNKQKPKEVIGNTGPSSSFLSIPGVARNESLGRAAVCY